MRDANNIWASSMSSKECLADVQAELRKQDGNNPKIKDWYQLAEILIKNGYRPIPTHPQERRPVGKAWNVRVLGDPRALLVNYQVNSGLAVATGVGGLCAIDVDIDDPVTDERLRTAGISLDQNAVVRRGSKGYAVFLRYEGEEPLMYAKTGKIELLSYFKDNRGRTDGLVAGSAVIPPTWHPKIEQPYVWLNERTLFNTPIHELPILSKGSVNSLFGSELREERSPVIAASCGGLRTDAVRDYALREVQRKAKSLGAMAPNSGRNRALYDAVCYLGKFHIHNYLTIEELVQPLLSASEANGLVVEGDDLPATINSALQACKNDPMPDWTLLPAFISQPVNSQSTPGANLSWWDDDGQLPEPIPYVVDQLIPSLPGMITFLGGQSRTYKTFMEIMLAVCIASGTPFFGYKVEPAPVLMLIAEGEGTIKSRLLAAKQYLGIDYNLPIRVATKMDMDNLDELHAILGATQYGLITIDTIASAYSIEDIDKPRYVIETCRKMRALGLRFNVPVLGLVHFGKTQGSGISGSHQWTAQADGVMAMLQEDAENAAGTRAGVRFHLTKNREGGEGPICYVQLEQVDIGLPKLVGVVTRGDNVETNEIKRTKSGDIFLAIMGEFKTQHVTHVRSEFLKLYPGENAKSSERQWQRFFKGEMLNYATVSGELINLK